MRKNKLSLTRVDLKTPKMLITKFHTSSVWENARHTIFIQFRKMGEKDKNQLLRLLILIKQSVDKKTSILVF